MIANLQIAESVDTGDGRELDIMKVWYTIQGEGPFAGRPAIFVRLAGCNIQCPKCDTNYTVGRKRMSVEAIGEWIRTVEEQSAIKYRRPLVVITGGEPFRQNLMPLVMHLQKRSITDTIQIETNGMFCPKGFDFSLAHIVCSPKARIHPKLQYHLKGLKYVLQHGHIADDGLPLDTLGNTFVVDRPNWDIFPGEVFVQPLDEQESVKNSLNLTATVRSAMTHGYRLCLQTHKLLGLE